MYFFEQGEFKDMTRWGGVPPLWGRSEPPRHDGVRQHPSSPGLRNHRGLELGLDPAGACAEFRDDAARPTRACALEGDPRAASASDACLRLQRCAPSPPSGGPQELRVQGIADGELASEPDPWSTSPPQREIWNRREPAQAAQTCNGRRFGAARDIRTSPSESHHEVELLL